MKSPSRYAMNGVDVVQRRLCNQKLSSPEFQQAVDVVRHFGAVQAQDFNAAKWALALRMRNATNADIEEAYDRGSILRTHLMRPTWHFVTPDDIRWLLQLTGPRVNLRSGPNYRKLELDVPTFKRSNKTLANALKNGKHLTRSALREALNRSGVAANDSIRLAHILLRAELDGVVCSGPRSGKQFTYALLDERVPATKALSRDEALVKLTRRYFTSHGPATVQDFLWWSGLSAADARHGMALAGGEIEQASIDGKVFWSLRFTSDQQHARYSAHLLPAYDEYCVAYKDRQAVLGASELALRSWDLLGPTIIIDGKAAGIWKREGENMIVLKPARKLKRIEKQAVTKAIDRYQSFLGVTLQTVAG